MHTGPAATPDFRSEPLVAGALGSVDAAVLGLMVESRPGLSVRAREPRFVIASDPAVEHWSNGSAEGWRWNALNPEVCPSSWQEAQRVSMSSGVAVDGDRVVLHNDLFGMQQLFFFEHRGGIYFSNWLPVLAAAAPALTVDPAAWASILVLGFAIPGSSPFAEIRSLAHCSAVSVGGDSVETIGEGPLPSSTRHDGSGATVGAVVRDLGVALLSSNRPRAVTLSGGWDSRLLLGVSAAQRDRVEAWTTSTDDGLDLDLELARPVARFLDVAHVEVVPEADSWAASSAVAGERFSCQTWMHAWLEPLAAAMRSSAVEVIDGLAGDVLFKGLFQDPTDDTKGSSVRARRELWGRLGGGWSLRDDVWSSEALALFDELAFSSFDAYIAPMVADPTWQMSAVLTTRTARAVALSPLRLFGPELSVRLPFLSPQVLGAAFSGDLHRRRGGALYRELLAETDPRLAALPSTNDVTTSADRGARRQEHPGAMRRFVEVIGAVEPALRLLAPQLREAIDQEDLAALSRAVRWDGPLAGLQAVHGYAGWRLAYPAVRGDIT